MVQAIPDGCNTVTAYLIVKDGSAALEFYKKAFGAEGGMCMEGPGGSLMHAELRIGDSTVMLSEESPQWGTQSPETLGGSPVSLHLYVEDVDSAFQKALDAGCKEVAPLMNTFWGDRYGKVVDPFGFQWGIATHVEDVSPEEMVKRQQEWMKSMSGPE